MGKRELVIILAFAAAGAIVYQFTAPAPKPGERGFSLSRIFSGIRQQVRSHSASVTATRTGTIALRPGVSELRITVSRRVPLTVTGERRADIGYDLTVESTGPDEATAREWASRVALEDDDLGVAQTIAIAFPPEGTQSGRLTLRVPDHLVVQLENAGRVEVSAVHGVDLRGLAGDAVLSAVSGAVTGSHRTGELTVKGAGSVKLDLASSRAALSAIAGPIQIGGRNGECAVTASRGDLDASMSNAEVTVTGHGGAIRVSGDGGTLRVVRPAKDVSVDVRRMLVELTLAAAVPATVVTTEEPLRLTLAGPPAIALDAVAVEGAIRAADLGLEASKADGDARLAAPVGGGGPRVVLRNRRADIVITVRK